MIINKSFNYWIIDGNQNWKFGYQEDDLHRSRKPDDETLEEEFLRLFPRMWKKLPNFQTTNGFGMKKPEVTPRRSQQSFAQDYSLA
jgi:hypothetical protein